MKIGYDTSNRIKAAPLPAHNAARSFDVDPVTARVIRLYLERVAMRLEHTNASHVYYNAFKQAARIVRESKPD